MLPWIGVAWAQEVPLAVGEADADGVRAALAALWPDAPVELLVGGDPSADGLSYAAGELAWRSDGVVVERVAGVDPDTAVLLARSWLAARDVLGGDAPEIPFVELEPPDPPARPARAPAPRERFRPTRWWIGGGATGAIAGPGVHTGAGWLGDPIEVDLSLRVALGGASAVTDAERERPAAVGESALRVAAVGVDAVWDLGLPRRVAGRLTVGPILGLGVEAGPTLRRRIALGPPVRADVDPPYLGGSLAGTAGIDLWAGGIGLRGFATARTTALGVVATGGATILACGRSKDSVLP